MRRIQLDFEPLRWGPGPAGIACLVIAGAALLVAGWLYANLHAKHEELAATLLQREAAAGRGAGARAVDAPDAAQAAAVLASIGVPWATLFDGLEAAAGQGVVLTGVQPEVEARRVRISGQARQFSDIAVYAHRLDQTHAFANVLLVAHEAHDQRIAFTLQADWVSQP
jgi:Tfp pilus assembly protein PilN